MNIQDKRNQITSLIYNIKDHSDRLVYLEALPLLELSVILSKITKLHESALILKYLSAKKQNYLEEEFGFTKRVVPKFEETTSIEESSEAQTLIAESEKVETSDSMDLMTDAILEETEEVLETVEKKENEIPKAEKETESDGKLTTIVNAKVKTEVAAEDVTSESKVSKPDVEIKVENSVVEQNEREREEQTQLNSPKEEVIEAIKKEVENVFSTEEAEEILKDAELKTEISAQPDINEVFTTSDDSSVGGHLQKSSIPDLISAIGLNERYLYANDLFEGNMDEFKKAISMLNDFESRSEAKLFFEEQLVSNYGWKNEDPMVKALESLVDRRYLS